MLQATKEAYYEVDTILNFLNKSYVSAIPLKLREKFKKNKAENYNKKIVPYKQLNEQNLKAETLAILAILNCKYWCKDENKKKELLDLYHQNDLKYEQELREKYNPDNLFKKNTPNTEIKENHEEVAITVIKKQGIISKIINFIKSIFSK